MSGEFRPTRYRAIISDYGGVLTSNTRVAMAGFCETDGIDPEAFGALMREWLNADAAHNPLHALETGSMTGPEFEAALASRLTRRDGSPIIREGLLTRMFAGSSESPVLIDVFHRAKAAGMKIGLLSNSWANDYPTHLWGGVFDDLVVSGEVGLRKPQAEIYELAAARLDVPASACIFIDDISPNIRGAVAVGMTGILHADDAATVSELEVLTGLALR